MPESTKSPAEVLGGSEYPGALPFMAMQLVDSSLATTREFWRSKFFAATPEEASDPRPFREVLALRQASIRGGGA